MSQGSDSRDELRALRQVQLAQLTTAELRAEIREHQRATWHQAGLLEHAKKHRRDWEHVLGYVAGPEAIARLSEWVIQGWDRILTGIEAGGTTYVFVKQTDSGIVVVVASRRGTIRTAFPTSNLLGWMRRHEQYIDISNRALLAFRGD